jgi:hypothetical protein
MHFKVKTEILVECKEMFLSENIGKPARWFGAPV